MEDLGSEIKSSKKRGRKLAMLKTVLKKRDIDKFQRRLDKAHHLLHLLQVSLSSSQVAQASPKSAQLSMVLAQLGHLT